MRWIICLLLCIACTNFDELRAAEPVEQTPEKALEEVIEHLRKDEISEAFAEMLILGLPQQSPDQIEEKMLGFKKSRQAMGKSLGEIELIHANRLGSRVARLTYFAYSERHLLVWRFTLYRGSKDWRILSVNWNHDFEELLNNSKPLSQKSETTKP